MRASKSPMMERRREESRKQDVQGGSRAVSRDAQTLSPGNADAKRQEQQRPAFERTNTSCSWVSGLLFIL